MAHVDGILLSSLLFIYSVVGAIIEDYAVLQNLAYRGTLVVVGSLEDFYSLRTICSYRASKESATCSEA